MEILPAATKLAKRMAYLGLAFGVLYSGGGLVYDLLTIGLNWGTVMAFGALVGMPAIFGMLGFVLGTLIAIVVDVAYSGSARDG